MSPNATSISPEELGMFDGYQRRGIVQGQFINYYQIESALLEYLDILEAGVVAKNNVLQPILNVYLVLSQTQKQENGLFCQKAAHFINSQFKLNIPIRVQTREKLPMTRSGKLSRSVLESWN